MGELWKLGVANQKKQKKDYRFFTLAIFASTAIVLLFFTLQHGGYQFIQMELRRNVWVNDVSVFFGITDEHPTLIEESADFISFNELEVLRQNYAIKSIVIEHRTSDVNFRLFFNTMEVEPPSQWMSGIDTDYDTFSYTSIRYQKLINADFEPLINGRTFTSKDERVAIIDENSARMLGFDTAREVVDQEFVFLSENDEEITVTIIGVYASELGPMGQLWDEVFFETPHYSLDGLRNILSDSILVSSDVIEFLNRDEEASVSSILFSGEDFERSLELYESLNRRFDHNNILSEAEFIVTTFENISLFTRVFGSIGVILLLLSFLNLYTIALLNAQKRKKWFALQTILGFKTVEIWLSYTFETVITVLKGFLLALATNFIIVLLFNLIAEHFLLEFVANGMMIFRSLSFVALVLFGVVLIFLTFIGLLFNIKLKKMNVIQTMFR